LSSFFDSQHTVTVTFVINCCYVADLSVLNSKASWDSAEGWEAGGAAADGRGTTTHPWTRRSVVQGTAIISQGRYQ